jgi:hypothetical protein
MVNGKDGGQREACPVERVLLQRATPGVSFLSFLASLSISEYLQTLHRKL